MGANVEDDAVLPEKMVKKSTKKKNEADSSLELGDSRDPMANRMEDNYELNNEDDRSKKVKQKHVVHSAKVDNIHQNEKKNRKKRKLEAAEEKGALENETRVEGEEKGTSGNDEAEKDEKKRLKKSRKKNGSEIILPLAEIHSNNNERESGVIEGQKSSDVQLDGSCSEVVKRKEFVNTDDICRKEKDEKKKRKKRKIEAEEEKDVETYSGGVGKRTLLSEADDDGGLNARDEKTIKKSRKKHGNEVVISTAEIHLDKSNSGREVIEGQKSSEKEDILEIENGEEGYRKKVEKKKKKKKKSKKKDGANEFSSVVHEKMMGETGNESTVIEDEDLVNNGSSTVPNKNDTLDKETRKGKKGKKKLKSVDYSSEDPKSKKVRFSSHVEIFPSSDDPISENDKNQDKDLVRGKRFSPEEDEMVKEAVFKYIEEHGLGEAGLDMVLHCKSHPKIKNCWKDIALFLPHRPHQSIYYRAHILFERAERREWTPEELELVRNLHKKHGSEWKKIADTLGKYRVHVKDTWRRIKLPNAKKGHWSQEEYQNLFDLVNLDLRMKAFEEKKSKHGMLRDNIAWSAISDRLTTRSDALCCMKWYQQLTSSMVAEGEWADTDDYHLLIALFSLDACCVEDVDWDNLLEHRSGDICRKRWNQMVRHLGQFASKSFAEQVEILANRYCQDVLEAREVWDSKPMVP